MDNIESHLLIIPEGLLEKIIASQERILEIIEPKKEESLNGYITEKQAMKVINKKVTWFWQMRKTGLLPYKKIGKTTYYSLGDIKNLLLKP